MIPDSIKTEVSGGINPSNIGEFHGCGVDYILLGSLTHSIKVLDLSLLVVNGEIRIAKYLLYSYQNTQDIIYSVYRCKGR